jgi:hypothetical protein
MLTSQPIRAAAAKTRVRKRKFPFPKFQPIFEIFNFKGPLEFQHFSPKDFSSHWSGAKE